MATQAAVKERPVLFSGEMVRAILDGRKTQTRRIIDLPTFRRSETPGYDWTWRGEAPVRSIAQQKRKPRGCWQDVTNERFLELCPYGKSGDRLWVKEAFYRSDEHGNCYYTADNKGMGESAWIAFRQANPQAFRSIFMPRWASRLTLEIESVRVEQLRDITEDDAVAEGFYLDGCGGEGPVLTFKRLWDELNAGRGFGFDLSPWVWVITFRRL